MTEGNERTSGSKGRREFRVNLLFALISIIVILTGVLLNNGTVFGVGLFLFIFFVIYTIYGVVKQRQG